MVLPRINGKIRLDGVVDEAAWQGVAPLPFTRHSPDFGREPSERTEVLIAYDDEHLYVAGRLYDREPSGIQANSRQRDSGDASSDWFGVILDTFNDKENAVAFFTTPAGLRWDAAVFDDARGENPLNFDWNSFWDVAVSRSGQGWFVEMRIPLSSLRFQTRQGDAVMGIISWRSIARKNEWVIFPEIPPNWGFWSLFKPSMARECVLRGVRRKNPLYLTPHILGGWAREEGIRRTQRDVGIDIKYGLTSNMTLDATVNPDFAQVETDDAQVNLTRFPLFYPEKRPFFQERAAIFDFGFEGGEFNRLFYSRRIGLDGGLVVPIYGGGRVIGRIGGWDIGVLDMQTTAGSRSGSENCGVFRVRRQIFNPYSYAGGIMTSRISAGGRFNLVYGLDARVRLFGDDYVTVKWAQSFRDSRENDPLSVAPARIFAQWSRETDKGPGYAFCFSRSGSDFDPGLGFETRKDFSFFRANLGYGWIPGPDSALFSHAVRFEAGAYLRNSDRRVESAWAGGLWRFKTKSGFSAYVSPYWTLEDLLVPFEVAREAAVVPPGRYRNAGFASEFSSPSVRSLALAAKLETGGFYDGRRFSSFLTPTWNASSVLRIEGAFGFDRVSFPDRSQVYASRIVRVRALCMLSVKLSASAFVQYESDGRRLAGNVRVRYNPREGVDLYVVFNEARTRSGLLSDPADPPLRGRALILKLGYTF